MSDKELVLEVENGNERAQRNLAAIDILSENRPRDEQYQISSSEKLDYSMKAKLTGYTEYLAEALGYDFEGKSVDDAFIVSSSDFQHYQGELLNLTRLSSLVFHTGSLLRIHDRVRELHAENRDQFFLVPSESDRLRLLKGIYETLPDTAFEGARSIENIDELVELNVSLGAPDLDFAKLRELSANLEKEIQAINLDGEFSFAGISEVCRDFMSTVRLAEISLGFVRAGHAPEWNQDDYELYKRMYLKVAQVQAVIDLDGLYYPDGKLEKNFYEFAKKLKGLDKILEVSPKELLGNLSDSTAQVAEKMEKLKKTYLESKEVIGIREKALSLVPKIEASDYEIKEIVDEQLLTDLVILDELNARKLEATRENIELLKSDTVVTERVGGVIEKDSKNLMTYGFELEMLENFDKSSIPALRDSIINRYKDAAEARSILVAIRKLGIPIDQDALGEVSMPRSIGYNTQVEALKILINLGVIKDGDFALHINFGGLEQTPLVIEDLLLTSLAINSTDYLGKLEDTGEAEIGIGFGRHSQKELYKDENDHSRIGPLGLPIMIHKNGRSEFRGVVTAKITLAEVERGMPILDRMLNSIREYHTDGTGNWAQFKKEFSQAASEIVYADRPDTFVRSFGKHNPNVPALSIYLRNLVEFAGFERDMHKKKDQFDFEGNLDRMTQLAMEDVGFIAFCLTYYGKLPEKSSEILKRLQNYYKENQIWQYGDKNYQIKTFESTRGRVTLAGMRNQGYATKVATLIDQLAA